MTQLTGEEWGKVAERLGMAADKLKKLINLILESGHALEEAGEEIRDIDMEEAKATLQEWRELEETMRLAVAAVLWVICTAVQLKAGPNVTLLAVTLFLTMKVFETEKNHKRKG